MANLWLDLKGPILADTVYVDGVLAAKDVTIALPPVNLVTADFKAMGTYTAPLPGQICKLVLGLPLAVAIKTLLKAPLRAILDAGPADAIRYLVLVLFVGCIWPLTFPFFARLGRKKEDA